LRGASAPLGASTPAFTKYSQRLRGHHSPLEGESQSQLVGNAERGQNILDNQSFRAKKKNSKKYNFLILFLINNFFNLLKKITPHPNPLPTSGERG